MMRTKDLIEWLQTLPADSHVGIDDGGLALQAVSSHGLVMDAYIEVGGIPDNDESEAPCGW